MGEQGQGGKVSTRLMSIDALRGFDMFWIVGGMEVVHSLLQGVFGPLPAGVEYHFDHVKWIGFSAWDLIMPLFLFITGVSMPFAFSRRVEQGADKWPIYRHVLKRVVVLWILGMMVQGNLFAWDLSKLHIYSNTLQSIAAGYLITTIALLHLRVRGQVILTGALLLFYWAVMALVPFGECAAGTLEPRANLALYIDEQIMGPFLRDGTTYTWIFSSITFGASVLMGALAGQLLRSGLAPYRKAAYLAAVGVGCVVAGLLWGLVFPIIKHIWTSSMTVYAAGWSFLLLALFYLIIDVWAYRKWAFFFVVIGMNAIAVYMAAHLIHFDQIAAVFVGKLVERMPVWGEFLQASVALAIIWSILYYMYRKGTFIKV